MKTTLLILAALLISCHIEPIDVSENGYLSFKGSIPDLSTFKAVVPECSDFTPNEIYYKLIRPDNGGTYTQTAPIIIEGNQIYSDGQMTFIAGNYQVDEVSLRFNGIVTHTAPYENDPRYDFGRYVNRTLPYNINIVANETTEANDQVVCYTEEELIEITGDFEWIGEIVELQTMYFYITEVSCVQYITIDIDMEFNTPDPESDYSLEIPVSGPGLYHLLVPKFADYFILRAFLNEGPPLFDEVDEIHLQNGYNPDGILEQIDVVFFENCI